MALFTNKQDRHLPLLTQFYQLNVYFKAEYEPEDRPRYVRKIDSRFSSRFRVKPSGMRDKDRRDLSEDEAIAPELDRFLYLFEEDFTDDAYNSPFTWTETAKPGLIHTSGSSWQTRLEEVHSAVCDLMDAMVIGNDLSLDPEDDATHLPAEFGSSSTSPPQAGDDIPLPTLMALNDLFARYVPHPRLALDQGKVTVIPMGQYRNRKETPLIFMAAVLVQLLNFVEEGRRFLKCEECRSAFQPVHEERRYCSYRCAARAGQRRRRKNAAGEAESGEIEPGGG